MPILLMNQKVNGKHAAHGQSFRLVNEAYVPFAVTPSSHPPSEGPKKSTEDGALGAAGTKSPAATGGGAWPWPAKPRRCTVCTTGRRKAASLIMVSPPDVSGRLTALGRLDLLWQTRNPAACWAARNVTRALHGLP
jgi:hypothetical protein